MNVSRIIKWFFGIIGAVVSIVLFYKEEPCIASLFAVLSVSILNLNTKQKDKDGHYI